MPSCGYKVYVMSHTFFNTGGWNKLSSIASFILAQLVGLLMETTINENRFVRATKQQMAHLKPQSITFQLQTDFSDLGLHSITFHRSLESIDRIDFCDNHFASESYKSLGWSFANIAVTGHDCCFACKKEEIQKWARDYGTNTKSPKFYHELPANMTLVARFIPSTSDSRHPYRLSNLLWKSQLDLNQPTFYKGSATRLRW